MIDENCAIRLVLALPEAVQAAAEPGVGNYFCAVRGARAGRGGGNCRGHRHAQ